MYYVKTITLQYDVLNIIFIAIYTLNYFAKLRNSLSSVYSLPLFASLNIFSNFISKDFGEWYQVVYNIHYKW